MEKAMATHSSTLAWKIPWVEEPGGLQSMGRKELDTTERLHFHFSLSCIGEGNGNPLQCSCLENPRDGGAWWAAVYGVAQSQTRLKRLSSSSSSSSGIKTLYSLQVYNIVIVLKFILLIYFWLCWFFVAGSGLFSSCREWGLLASCGVWASHCGGFSRCGAHTLGMWAQQLWHTGLVVLRLGCRIFLDQGSNLCLLLGRQNLYHWATREAPI